MSKHTPGPWKADKNRHVYPAEFSNYDKDPICKVYTDEETKSAMFNAHLIASAPEMFEAIQNWLEKNEVPYLCRSDESLEEKLRAAIKKAKGIL